MQLPSFSYKLNNEKFREWMSSNAESAVLESDLDVTVIVNAETKDKAQEHLGHFVNYTFFDRISE